MECKHRQGDKDRYKDKLYVRTALIRSNSDGVMPLCCTARCTWYSLNSALSKWLWCLMYWTGNIKKHSQILLAWVQKRRTIQIISPADREPCNSAPVCGGGSAQFCLIDFSSGGALLNCANHTHTLPFCLSVLIGMHASVPKTWVSFCFFD